MIRNKSNYKHVSYCGSEHEHPWRVQIVKTQKRSSRFSGRFATEQEAASVAAHALGVKVASLLRSFKSGSNYRYVYLDRGRKKNPWKVVITGSKTTGPFGARFPTEIEAALAAANQMGCRPEDLKRVVTRPRFSNYGGNFKPNKIRPLSIVRVQPAKEKRWVDANDAVVRGNYESNNKWEMY